MSFRIELLPRRTPRGEVLKGEKGTSLRCSLLEL